MNNRVVALSAALALLTPMMDVDAKGATRPFGASGTSNPSMSPEGTPTTTVLVPIGGLSTNNLCGSAATPGAGNTVVTANIGAGAVVTGLGGVGSFEAFSPSFRDEVVAIFRGSVPAEAVALSFSTAASPGVATFNIAPIDLTSVPLANIQVGPTGVLSIELCEDFADTGVNPDATFAAGTFLRVACFNCFDPFGEPPLAAPVNSPWALISLLLGLGLMGGIAVRRFS